MQLRKRFYREAAAGEVPGGGFTVLLDGRAVKTPGGRALDLPTAALAMAIAEEWEAQGDEIRPPTMRLMRLACTAIDRLPDHREAVIDEVSTYVGTDLICYRADHPAELVARQERLWDPLLDWAVQTHGLRCRVTRGVVPVAPEPETVLRARETIAAHNDLGLSALAEAVRVSGSLIIGLALAAGRLDAEAAFEAAEVDETYQIEQWGQDVEAEARRSVRRQDLISARRLMESIALSPSPGT